MSQEHVIIMENNKVVFCDFTVAILSLTMDTERNDYSLHTRRVTTLS